MVDETLDVVVFAFFFCRIVGERNRLQEMGESLPIVRLHKLSTLKLLLQP